MPGTQLSSSLELKNKTKLKSLNLFSQLVEIITKSRYPYFAVFLDINDIKGIKFHVVLKEETVIPLFVLFMWSIFMSLFNNNQLLDFRRMAMSSVQNSFQYKNR